MKAQFVDAIRTYGVHFGLKLKIQRNDNRRLRVICLGAKGKCKWFAYCGYVAAKNIWQLRKVVDKHTCSRIQCECNKCKVVKWAVKKHNER